MAQSTTYIELDWRNTVRREDMLEKLDKFLTYYDSTGRTKLCLVNSVKKKLVRHEATGNTMVLQEKAYSRKVYGGGSGASASRTDKYLSRMVAVVRHISSMIDAGNQCSPREMHYKFQGGDFSEAQIAQLFADLALTIEVHPYLLGVAPEVGKSLVRVPTGVRLDLEVITNIFLYTKDNRRVVRRRCGGGDSLTIPPMIRSVSITQHDQTIRAVVVSEHKSIKDKLERHLDKPGFQGILLVLTSGFPDAACREFLHLLSVSPELADVPFLWSSDCDAHSGQMYTVLKHGSVQFAHASPIMVCPQLTFGGLTMEKFEGFLRGWPARFVAGKHAQTPLSEDAQQELLRQKTAIVDNKMQHLRGLPSCQKDKHDQQRLAGMKRLGVLDLAGEEELKAQWSALDSGGKMSFHRLDELEQDGMAFFMAEQVAAVRDETFVHPPMFGDWSQTRAAWNAASQHALNRIVEEQDEEEEEEEEPVWDMGLM